MSGNACLRLILASEACVSLSCAFCTVRLALLVCLTLAASSFAVLMCAPRDMRGKTVSMLCESIFFGDLIGSGTGVRRVRFVR